MLVGWPLHPAHVRREESESTAQQVLAHVEGYLYKRCADRRNSLADGYIVVRLVLRPDVADPGEADETAMDYGLKDLCLWVSDMSFNPHEPMIIE